MAFNCPLDAANAKKSPNFLLSVIALLRLRPLRRSQNSRQEKFAAYLTSGWESVAKDSTRIKALSGGVLVQEEPDRHESQRTIESRTPGRATTREEETEPCALDGIASTGNPMPSSSRRVGQR